MDKEKKSGLTRINFRILVVGIILISIGYLIMGTGDSTISPLLLIIGYVIIIPIALLWRKKHE